jgi:hypothetical protein
LVFSFETYFESYAGLYRGIEDFDLGVYRVILCIVHAGEFGVLTSVVCVKIKIFIILCGPIKQCIHMILHGYVTQCVYIII